MKTVLITGASDFLGLNLGEALRRRGGTRLRAHDRTSPREALAEDLAAADVVCHLETIYRADSESAFEEVNAGLTRWIAGTLEHLGRRPRLLYASSTRAGDDSAYGRSKLHAEEVLADFADRTGASLAIFRLPNEFGKWCPPNHNSVVATFCYALARDLEISVREPDRVLTLAYVDDIVAAMLAAIDDASPASGAKLHSISPTFPITVGALAEKLQSFRRSRRTLVVPDFADRLTQALHATYLSYLEGPDFTYGLDKKTDARGALAEYFKSAHFGQVFVSRTRPGVIRGNHYHDSKTEKFCVLEGKAVIRFRHIVSGESVTHRIRGEEFKVVDIPPGYTHSIENVGNSDLIVLFWASEVFDPKNPDTYPSEVLRA